MNSTCILHRKLSQNLFNRLQLIGTTSTVHTDIKIPNRIERGPTDILKALEKTITKDPLAPHYKYHDDPYLIPYSKTQQRSYALARESGRKAAKWVQARHYDLFQHKVADPMIPGYVPALPIDDENEVNEDILMTTILNGDVENAIKAYKYLNGEVSIPTKQALLELLCIFNQPPHLQDDLPESNWCKSLPEKRLWEDKPEIDELFNFLKEQDKDVAAAAYSAMICGTAKYFNVQSTWTYYGECKDNKIPLSVNAFNLLISRVPLLQQSDQNCKIMFLDLLREMNLQNVRPNVGTFNSCLFTVANMQSSEIAVTLTQQLFKEFKKINVDPSLASYAIALVIFKRSDYPYLQVFTEILNMLEQQMPPINDTRDTHFFKIAMESALEDLCNREIADRIHKLLLTGDNYKLMGGQFKEIVYYRSYMLIKLSTDSIQNFQKFYENIVPHVYIPEATVLLSILTALEPYAREDIVHEFLPRLWSDIQQFGYTDKVGKLPLRLMCTHVNLPPDSPMHNFFADAAWSYWTNFKKLQEKGKNPTWNNGTLGIILTLLVRGKSLRKLYVLLRETLNFRIPLNDVVKESELEEVLNILIAYRHTQTAFVLLDYALCNAEASAGMIAKKMKLQLDLTPSENAKLERIIQENAFDVEIRNDE